MTTMLDIHNYLALFPNIKHVQNNQMYLFEIVKLVSQIYKVFNFFDLK